MSWFQSTNIASFAKTALKEAQRTIDKALDIGDSTSPENSSDGSLTSSTTSDKVAAAVTGAATDFFASWGMVGKGSKNTEEIISGEERKAKPPVSKELLQHKRSMSLEGAPTKEKEKNMEGMTSSQELQITDIPVTLLPHENTDFVTGSSSTHTHQRSFSDTVFNLTSEFHEAVQVLDEPCENEGSLKIKKTAVAAALDPAAAATQEPLQKQTDSKKEYSDSELTCDTSFVSTPRSKGGHHDEGVFGETLITVDLNSPSNADESWTTCADHTPTPSDTLFTSDNSGFDSSGWSWAESTSMCEDISEGRNRHESTGNSRLTEHSDKDKTPIPTPLPADQIIDAVSPPLDESPLESSSGTLQEISFQESTETEVGENECQQADKILKQASPPASSISALDSPRSSSSYVHDDSRRTSPDRDHHFDLLPSKGDCMPGRIDFLPESSRSSSIIVMSGRASSGGSGSNVSTASDMNIDEAGAGGGYHAHYQHHRHQTSDGSSSYEKVSIPPSPEFVKSAHRKGPSSASSSDIEVVLAQDYVRHEHARGSVLATVEQQTSLECLDQGTQTDLLDDTQNHIIDQLPKRVTDEIADIIAEKDQVIDQLREEGEKLSKKQFDQSQLIKKLRTKEKEMENTIKTLKGEIAGKNLENDRLTKSFVNKESTEKALNENVQKLMNEKRALELRVEQLQSELEDAKENCASMKASVEDASVEILELKNAILSAQRDSTEIDNLTREKAELITRNESLQKELDNLRTAVSTYQEKGSKRESELNSQVASLARKVHELENQGADVSSEVADAIMPLSLEIEKLQSELKHSQSNFEKREALLTTQLLEVEHKWKCATDKEHSLKDQLSSQESILSSLESKVQQLERENSNLKRDQTFREENEGKRHQEKMVKISKMENHIEKLTSEIERLVHENEKLALELKTEKTLLEQERKHSETLVDQMSSGRNLNQTKALNPNNNEKSGENSPRSPSLASESSYLDEVFDNHVHIQNHRQSLTPRSSFFDSYSTTGLMEHLQAQLRQREAEVSQFQEEIQKNEKIRKSLNEEIAKLTMRNHEFQMETERLSGFESRLEQLGSEYNTLLQLYGEKVEEADELRLDLQDVKDMYKAQIEQLLKKS